MPEPGRRIVAEETDETGNALPWVNPLAFALRALEMATSDLAAVADTKGTAFFDRGLIDAAVACTHAGGAPYHNLLPNPLPYARRVYLTPPWPEIFVQDSARQHSFAEAELEYLRLIHALNDLGCDACILPKASIHTRVDFILRDLGLLS